MRSSDYLFRLIKALSKGDRRNFKLYAQLQEGDKQYIKLFDAIDKQSEYDEERLLKQFEGEKFTNQFSVAKNYLYNYILKTLHIFRKDSKTELNALIHQVQILMSKNLYEQAQKLLRKAKHLAERQERFPDMLLILETERNLMLRREQAKEFEAFVEGIQVAEEETVAKIANQHAYNHLYDSIYRLMKRSLSARDPEIRSKVEAILSNPLVADAHNALSTRARLRRFDILVDGLQLLGDSLRQLDVLKQLVETYESNEDICREKQLSYINAVSNLGVAYFVAGKSDKSAEMMDKLHNLPVESEEAELHVFEKYYKFKISFCIEIGDIAEARKAIAEFEQEYPLRAGAITKAVELTIFYSIAYFYIYIGEPANALDWVNRIMNEPRTELRVDIQAITRIMNLIIHYQLGNWEYLEYGQKSAARFLANRDRLFLFEKTILKYIRQLSTLNPDVNISDVFRDFKAEINEVIKDPLEAQALWLFNIISWIDAQAIGTTMWQIETEAQALQATKK